MKIMPLARTTHRSVGSPGIVLAPFAGPLYKDRPNTAISFRADAEALAANQSEGVQQLHHHNTVGKRAEDVGAGAGGRAVNI